MSAWTINSESSLQRFIGDIREAFRSDKYLKVTAKSGKPRSLPQNALQHAWYEQIAQELREDDAAGWKSYCKLHHGVPILRAEDAQFREFYDNAMKRTLTYEQKLDAMRFVPVTSLMTKAQLTTYLDRVRNDFRAKGVLLEYPEE